MGYPLITFFQAEIFNRRLEPGKAEIQRRFPQPCHGKRNVRIFLRTGCGLFYCPAGGIRKAEQFAYFVKGFSSRVIDGLPKSRIAAEIVRAINCGMAARRYKCHDWKGQVFVLKKKRAKVPFGMVDADYRDTVSGMQSKSESDSHQQGARKTGTIGYRNTVEVGAGDIVFLKNRTGKDINLVQVRTRS